MKNSNDTRRKGKHVSKDIGSSEDFRNSANGKNLESFLEQGFTAILRYTC